MRISDWSSDVCSSDLVQGREAIRAEIERQREFSTFMECGIVKLVSAGLTVMTERLDYFTMHGVRVSHALVAVYDLDAEGKILSWREYFDTADLGKQLGMQPEAVIANRKSVVWGKSVSIR